MPKQCLSDKHIALQSAAQRTGGGIAAAAAAARHLGAARLSAGPRLEDGAHQANCSSKEESIATVNATA